MPLPIKRRPKLRVVQFHEMDREQARADLRRRIDLMNQVGKHLLPEVRLVNALTELRIGNLDPQVIAALRSLAKNGTRNQQARARKALGKFKLGKRQVSKEGHA
ncbi:MAG: hypothetical protein Q7S92_06920 [Candidatus Diapherotrites archaeon]|nr:hypothetical protein [Candidatus Diapherotrites archaeon]